MATSSQGTQTEGRGRRGERRTGGERKEEVARRGEKRTSVKEEKIQRRGEKTNRTKIEAAKKERELAKEYQRTMEQEAVYIRLLEVNVLLKRGHNNIVVDT